MSLISEERPQEFDPHVAIKLLAETWLSCPTDAQRGTTSRPGTTSSHPVSCVCSGSGIIVPFASLRVDCQMLLHNSPTYPCCGGRGWVPIQHDVVEKLEALCYETRKVGEERYVRLHENSTEYHGRGETPLSRLLSAIVLATEGEEKP